MLLIRSQRLAVSFRKALIYRAVLECADRIDLPVGIVCDNFETVQDEGLPHDIQVGAQRVHDLHAAFLRECLQAGIVCALGQ